MIYIFVIVLAVAGYWTYKRYFKKSRSGGIQITDFFTPKGTIRSFPIVLQIEEVGDGTVKISIKKDK